MAGLAMSKGSPGSRRGAIARGDESAGNHGHEDPRHSADAGRDGAGNAPRDSMGGPRLSPSPPGPADSVRRAWRGCRRESEAMNESERSRFLSGQNFSNFRNGPPRERARILHYWDSRRGQSGQRAEVSPVAPPPLAGIEIGIARSACRDLPSIRSPLSATWRTGPEIIRSSIPPRIRFQFTAWARRSQSPRGHSFEVSFHPSRVRVKS